MRHQSLRQQWEFAFFLEKGNLAQQTWFEQPFEIPAYYLARRASSLHFLKRAESHHFGLCQPHTGSVFTSHRPSSPSSSHPPTFSPSPPLFSSSSFFCHYKYENHSQLKDHVDTGCGLDPGHGPGAAGPGSRASSEQNHLVLHKAPWHLPKTNLRGTVTKCVALSWVCCTSM